MGSHVIGDAVVMILHDCDELFHGKGAGNLLLSLLCRWFFCGAASCKGKLIPPSIQKAPEIQGHV